MINNGYRNTNLKAARLIPTFLLVLLSPLTQGALYPFGIGYGDKKIDFESWELGSEQIDLDKSLPLLGNGKLSSVWINTIGTLTYRQLLVETSINSLVDNIALAPYYLRSREGAIGAVYYRQTTTDSSILRLIADDVSASLILPPTDVESVDFNPTYALIVTWSDVASVQDSSLINSFQIVLTTDGSRTFAIYNYDNTLEYSSSSSNEYAAAGIFTSPNAESQCTYELPNSQTEEASLLAQTIGNTGDLGRFILLISERLPCLSKFQSACERTLPSSDWGTAQSYFEISRETWTVYAQHTCNIGFEMKPGVNSERIECIYEPDYYSSTWERDPTKCLDLNATKTIIIETEISKVGNETIGPGGLSDKEAEELEELIENAIDKILNLTDTIIKVTNISTTPDDPFTRTERLDNETVDVTVIVHIPPYTHKKITEENITDIITNVLAENDQVGGVTFGPEVTVTDTTDSCLQGCICRLQKPPRVCPRGKIPQIQPDSCCGGCNGKPYSSTIKACCNNEHIYDPTKARCCNGRVRKGPTGKCPSV